MLDQVFGNRGTDQGVGSGGIGSYVDSFAGYLVTGGYAATTVRSRRRLLGHFSQWLTRRRCDIHELNDELIDTFVNHRKRRGRLHRGHATTLHQFLSHLRARGEAASPAPVVDESPLGEIQRHYEQYLRAERGLAPVTISKYVAVLRRFLTDRFGTGPLDLGALDVSTITTFLIRHAHTMSPGYAKGMGTALRSVCRFLLQRGAIDRDLATAVPRLPAGALQLLE